MAGCPRNTRISLVVLSLLYTWAIAQGPMELEWSNKTYGPEGPWYAIRASIGTPPQDVDLFPGFFGRSWPLGGRACALSTTGIGCEGGTYSSSKSRTVESIIAITNNTKTNATNIEAYNNMSYEAIYYQWMANTYKASVDTVSLFAIEDGPVDVPKAGLESVEESQVITVDFFNNLHLLYPPFVGFLSLGNFYPHPQLEDGSRYNDPQRYLYNQGKISSPSFGLHVGSPTLNITPSLYYGGYDRSRVLGPVLDLPLHPNQGLAHVALSSIEFGVEYGSSPFTKEQPDFVSSGGTPIDGSGLVMTMHPAAPGLVFPRSMCINLEGTLPIIYDQRNNYYLWDTTDPRYHEIMNSPSYMSFDLRPTTVLANGKVVGSTGEGITIKVPMRLLNLTAEPPIVGSPKPYFPCYSYPDDQGIFYLGRAFLQAAFYGINWDVKLGTGHWFLAQAPGPKIAPAEPTNITVGQTSIQSSSKSTYEESWKDYFESFAPRPTHGTFSRFGTGGTAGGLSTGAKAGIGVGVAVGVIALLALAFFLFRRRRRMPAPETSPESKAETATYPKAELDTNHTFSPIAAGLLAEKSDEPGNAPKELPSDGMKLELPANVQPAQELPATPPPVVELDVRPNSGRLDFDARSYEAGDDETLNGDREGDSDEPSPLGRKVDEVSPV